MAPCVTARKRIVFALSPGGNARRKVTYLSYDVAPQFINNRSWRICRPLRAGNSKFVDWLQSWRIANWMHQEIGCTWKMPQHQFMQRPKLTALVGELTAIKFSVHNCLKRQPRLTCRVVVYQFSGSAPIFDVYESDSWAQYECVRSKRCARWFVCWCLGIDLFWVELPRVGEQRLCNAQSSVLVRGNTAQLGRLLVNTHDVGLQCSVWCFTHIVAIYKICRGTWCNGGKKNILRWLSGPMRKGE